MRRLRRSLVREQSAGDEADCPLYSVLLFRGNSVCTGCGEKDHQSGRQISHVDLDRSGSIGKNYNKHRIFATGFRGLIPCPDIVKAALVKALPFGFQISCAATTNIERAIAAARGGSKSAWSHATTDRSLVGANRSAPRQ
jgi:hypothetical protein